MKKKLWMKFIVFVVVFVVSYSEILPTKGQSIVWADTQEVQYQGDDYDNVTKSQLSSLGSSKSNKYVVVYNGKPIEETGENLVYSVTSGGFTSLQINQGIIIASAANFRIRKNIELYPVESEERKTVFGTNRSRRWY